MDEWFVLMAVAGSLIGVFFGGWQMNNLWLEKARSITRKECRGNLYWVVEDGDTDKLRHIQDCFEKPKDGYF